LTEKYDAVDVEAVGNILKAASGFLYEIGLHSHGIPEARWEFSYAGAFSVRLVIDGLFVATSNADHPIKPVSVEHFHIDDKRVRIVDDSGRTLVVIEKAPPQPADNKEV
jgi:hypothetical protein